MLDESLRRGIESYVASFLREHVAEGLLARPEVRAALSPEALERVRAEVLDRLRRSEAEGMADRDVVRQGAQALASSFGTAGQEVFRAVACFVASQACPGAGDPKAPGPGDGR